MHTDKDSKSGKNLRQHHHSYLYHTWHSHSGTNKVDLDQILTDANTISPVNLCGIDQHTTSLIQSSDHFLIYNDIPIWYTLTLYTLNTTLRYQYRAVSFISLQHTRPHKGEDNHDQLYEPNPTNLPSLIFDKNQTTHDKLHAPHDLNTVQTRLLKANEHLHQLRVHTDTLYKEQQQHHPSTTINIIPYTAHARRHLNHAYKVYHKSIYILFLDAGLTITPTLRSTTVTKTDDKYIFNHNPQPKKTIIHTPLLLRLSTLSTAESNSSSTTYPLLHTSNARHHSLALLHQR